MTMTTTRTVLAAAVLLLVASALTGCATVAGTANAPRVGLLLPDSVTSRYEAADKPYFEAKLHALNPRATVLYANADGDAGKQLQQAESMLTQGVNVLVLDPYDSAAAASIVTEATAKHVPVISYDRLIAGGGAQYYISFDNERVGELQAQALVDKLKSDGVPAGSGIVMVNGSPTDNNAKLFKQGAHKIIDPSGYTVLGEFDAPGWEPSKAQDWVSGQVTKFGAKITGVYAANDAVAGGAIAALKAAGMTTVPPVTGQDAELAGIQRILAGSQYMTVYKTIKPEAEKAAEIALRLAKGEKPKGDTVVDGVQSTLLVPVAVTADTIQSTIVKDGFYAAAQICTSAYRAACAVAGVK
ncbi:MAG: D-xylose transport system substrate-binding protein [Actinomycetota bacterium]|nr:D-xylose transport system substrate-binding protein [Actinomycetota bacterium]